MCLSTIVQRVEYNRFDGIGEKKFLAEFGIGILVLIDAICYLRGFFPGFWEYMEVLSWD